MQYQGLPQGRMLTYGPHIPVVIAETYTIALLDTGVRHSFIDEDLVRDLGLTPVGATNTIGATGVEQRPTFDVDFSIPGLDTSVATLVRSLALRRHDHFWVAIVGRDILGQCDLAINWPAETISINRTRSPDF